VNECKLYENTRNVLEIKPVTTGPPELAAAHTLHLGLGAKVSLTVNYKVGLGLVNGAVGTLKGLKYKETPNGIQLTVLFVEFPGIYCDNVEFGHVPIFVHQDFIYRKGRKEALISQFPLALVYGLSVYRTQGITYSKALINLDKREIYSGATYSALSRVKPLKDFVIVDSVIRPNRFKDHYFMKRFDSEIAEARRLEIFNSVYNEYDD